MKRQTLVIPNEKALVQQVYSSKYSLTLQEKRLIYWLISEIKPDDHDFKPYRVSVKELTAFLGLENNNRIYQQMAQVTERLMRRVMKIEEPENESLLQVAWVSSARYHLGKGCVDISFDPQLKPYLIQLKSHFTSIELRYAIHLQSVYAMRIYELLKQYRKIGERVLPIVELRDMLGILPQKYQYINDFRRYVIDIAQREINTKTDIRFDYSELKQGRRITDIRFVVSSNTPAPVLDFGPAEQPGSAKLTRQLETHGVSSAEVTRLFADYDLAAGMSTSSNGVCAVSTRSPILPPGWCRGFATTTGRSSPCLPRRRSSAALQRAPVLSAEKRSARPWIRSARSIGNTCCRPSRRFSSSCKRNPRTNTPSSNRNFRLP
jgi:hypothetical protein